LLLPIAARADNIHRSPYTFGKNNRYISGDIVILKKSAGLIILFLSVYNSLYAQNFRGKPQNITISDPAKELADGETLEYFVEWLGIPVGKIVLKIEGSATINNYECYHITAKALPNSFFQHLYDLEYTVHTYIDKKIYCTRRFQKIRRMNKRYNHIIIDFDQEKHKALFFSEGLAPLFKISPERIKIEASTAITTEIPYGTQDLLSSFYYFRLLKISQDKNYPLNIYYNQRNWPMDMKVDKPYLRGIRKKGTFSIVRISLDSLLNNYILGKRRLIIYLTTDSRRIPIEFKLETALGPISARIKNLSQ